jgi:hypothetical protein
LLRVQGGDCDHRQLLLSLIYRLLRNLFGLLTILVRADLSKDVELLVLHHDNQVLRRQLHGRPQWDHDRLWLAALSRLVCRHTWTKVFPVTPATLRLPIITSAQVMTLRGFCWGTRAPTPRESEAGTAG